MDASDKPPSTLVHSECRRDESLHYLALVVLRRLLEHTTAIDVADAGRWLRSVLVRRLERLELTVGVAG